MKYRPPLLLGVVAIEKGAFWLPSTTVANFTYYIHLLCNLPFHIFLHIVNTFYSVAYYL